MMQYVPLLMFVALFMVLASGIPIAFSLSLIAILFGWSLWGIGGVKLLVTAAWGTMNNFALLAVPLFIFMALILQKSQVVEDIYDSFYKWSGPLRGGLAVATILVGAILGAVSGVVAAGVIGLGLIGLPQMLKYKYDQRLSLGAVMAGGTLGQLIPPSTNMVIYGAVTGVSVGSLFAGGLTCGIFLALLYCAYILVRSLINPNLCPALPLEDRVGWRGKVAALRKVFLPSLLILLVLGSVLSGAATPTEAAAVGAVGALFFSFFTKRLTVDIVKAASMETLEISSMVGWIIIGASAFGAIFSGTGGNRLVTEIAMAIPGGPWAVFSVAVLFVFFLGMFLEPTAMIMLAAPIVSPILIRLGFDPLWWGLVFMVLLQVAYLSPPFGFSLFYMRGAAPEHIGIEEIYFASIPFIGIQFVSLLFLVLFPGIALWLPHLLLN